MKKLYSLGSILLLASNVIVSQNEQPNLLVIHTDEQSFRSLSCYENCWAESNTPNIDLLAERGVKFENFYANHPVCTPSRSALLTGRYAHEVQSYLNNISLAEEAVTFGHILRENGYETGYVGKVHLAGTGKPQIHPDRDFGFTDNRYMFNRGHWKQINEENGEITVNSNALQATSENYTTDYLGNKTINFIKNHKGKKWCHFLSIPDPHGPDIDRPEYNDLYKDSELTIPETFYLKENEKPAWAPSENKSDKALEKFKKTKCHYLGMVKHIDDVVGKIIKSLQETDQFENTIIVFTSDHGDMMGEFGRYNKSIPLDAAAKVGHIISYPKRIEKGKVIYDVVSNVDFLPTICDLIGINYKNSNLRGQSMMPLIKGCDLNWKNTAFISLPGTVCIVTKDYKLVYNQLDEPYLYDRNKDKKEVKNYFNNPEYQSIVQNLTLQLKNYLITTKDPNYFRNIEDYCKLIKVKKEEFINLKSIIEKYSSLN